MLHFLVDRLRSLPDAFFDAPFVWLAEVGLVRLWHRYRAGQRSQPNVIEMPFIESRTKVFGLNLSDEGVAISA